MSYENDLPKDPFILFSTLNMKLRNQFSDLDKLCLFYQIDSADLSEQMNVIGYFYDSESNQFKSL